MAITRWSASIPTRDLTGLQDEVSRLFDHFVGRWPMRGDFPAVFTPPVDIQESPEEFILRADLPGMSQKDVKVSLMGDTLTLRGERKQETVQQEGGMHRVERLYGTFERSFTLGVPVRNDKVKATYKDGVLEVHVPKAEEARLREIEVQVG
jgi:HSP20 family protein